jgi:hypothetical protein
MSLKERIKERIKARTEEAKTTIKRNVPLTKENQEAWRQHSEEEKEKKERLGKIEHEAREHEEEERAKRRGRESVQSHPQPQSSSQSRRHRGSSYHITAVNPLEALGFGTSKPKPKPQRVTRISRGGTVTITEPIEDKAEKRKRSHVEFKDPFDIGSFLGSQAPKGKKGKKRSHTTFKDPFEEFM